MMNAQNLVSLWFSKWESGDFLNLPITENFSHSSPFGTIDGKEAYLKLVQANKEKFLNHRFIIHDALYEQKKACVRYTAIQEDFELDVSEWYYFKDNLIDKIFAYYHIGEIRDDRQLKTS
jgi:hypothetical protein